MIMMGEDEEKSSPIIVTYSTEEDCILARSAKAQGWPVYLLKDEEWYGFKYKFTLITKLIPLLKDQFTHLISLDAFDTIIVRPYSEWIPPKENLVIAAEVNCYPERDLEYLYPEVKTNFRFVNSHFCLNLKYNPPEDFFNINDDNDQLHLTRFYLNHLNDSNIKLDSNCETFQSLFQVRKELFTKDFMNLQTGTYPFFFHGNGKSDLSWIKYD